MLQRYFLIKQRAQSESAHFVKKYSKYIWDNIVCQLEVCSFVFMPQIFPAHLLSSIRHWRTPVSKRRVSGASWPAGKGLQGIMTKWEESLETVALGRWVSSLGLEGLWKVSVRERSPISHNRVCTRIVLCYVQTCIPTIHVHSCVNMYV